MYLGYILEAYISNKEITKRSGILTLLYRGDDVMPDRGFVINDLLEPLGCIPNIPPFLNNQELRIKAFKILKNVLFSN